jgi:hypothetical protein
MEGKMKDMKPTRILVKPEGHGERWKPIVCDTGTYDIHVLAEMIGLSFSGLYKRFRFVGWDHPEVLAKPRHRFGDTKKKEWNVKLGRAPGRDTAADNTGIAAPPAGVAGEWAHLGMRPRTDRLASIPQPTAWDLSLGA